MAANEVARTTFLEVVLTWPQVPLGNTVRLGRVYHTVYQHDAWCCVNYGAAASDCNCTPTISRHVQPLFSWGK